MINKIYRVTDLGPGDGGKGGVVQALARKINASLIIKEGGAQGSHGVVGKNGKFAFSQWGCGTLDNVPTYILPNFVISPIGLLNEAAALEAYDASIRPWSLLSASPSCICATPYHQVWSQLYELMLKDKPHGTVGTGVGKAYHEYCEKPPLAIYLRDMQHFELLRKELSANRERVLKMYGDCSVNEVLPEDAKIFEECQALLHSEVAFEEIFEMFLKLGQLLRQDDYTAVLNKFDGKAIIERSHGVLTDNVVGLRPHVSNLRTLPSISDMLLGRAGYRGEVVDLGVHRAYEIRHGAGPIPTADATMRSSLLPGSHKLTNRWQGEVRVGPLDLRLLKHAISLTRPWRYDGLCLTWFDQIIQNGEWQFAADYKLNGRRLPNGTELNAELLYRVEPMITTLPLPDLDREELAKWCQKFLSLYIDVPVRLVSFGPAPGDKLFI